MGRPVGGVDQEVGTLDELGQALLSLDPLGDRLDLYRRVEGAQPIGQALHLQKSDLRLGVLDLAVQIRELDPVAVQ